jgi:hypothetical protein
MREADFPGLSFPRRRESIKIISNIYFRTISVRLRINYQYLSDSPNRIPAEEGTAVKSSSAAIVYAILCENYQIGA